MDVPYEVDGRVCTGYLASPTQDRDAPGILVFPGAGGLGAHARERTDQLAQLGYVAFAADLFGRRVEGVENAQALTRKLTDDWQDMRRRATAALDVLLMQKGVDCNRLAAIGFCFGGQVALELARSGADIRAVVGFHSELETRRRQDAKHMKAKVLVCLGDSDRFVGAADREHFLAEMRSAEVDCQMLLFTGVQHSFTDRYAEASGITGLKYDATADRRSWAAMRALFDEVLI